MDIFEQIMDVFSMNDVLFDSQVLQCAPMWPRLEELYVAENDITELSRWAVNWLDASIKRVRSWFKAGWKLVSSWYIAG